MDKQKITTIREDLMDDFNALAQVLSEKIRKLREEFDDDQLQFKMELEAYQGKWEQLDEDQAE